jgi:hypothetical protein
MAGKDTDRATYARILKELRAFTQQTYSQAPLDERNFFYSKLDRETVSFYYRLRRTIKGSNIASPGIKQLVKKMPAHVWLLRKGVFEGLMISGLLIVLFFYIKYVPIFKGYLPVYICFSALSWFFLRRAIENLDADLDYSIGDLTKAIEKELRGMKK